MSTVSVSLACQSIIKVSSFWTLYFNFAHLVFCWSVYDYCLCFSIMCQVSVSVMYQSVSLSVWVSVWLFFLLWWHLFFVKSCFGQSSHENHNNQYHWNNEVRHEFLLIVACKLVIFNAFPTLDLIALWEVMPWKC